MADLPVFMHDPLTRPLLLTAASHLPKRVEAYLVGGAVRNAMYYRHFKEKLSQRDYDLFYPGDPAPFIARLRKSGFKYGKLRRKDEVVVMAPKFKGARELRDFVVFDIHFSGDDIHTNLERKTNFTINGFALPLRAVDSPSWYDEVISVRHAEEDLKARRLRVHAYDHPAQLYAGMRFVHKGFKPPTPEETHGMVLLLRRLRRNQFPRNMRKVFDGVGGEENARKIARQMGIQEDVFSFKTIEALKRAR